MIKSVVRDGRETFLWLDQWHPLGILFQRYEERVVRNLDRSLRAKVFSEQRIFKAKVASIIDQDSWKWH